MINNNLCRTWNGSKAIDSPHNGLYVKPMVLKHTVGSNEKAFTRAAYYWVMMLIDQFQKSKEMLKIDYESYIIIQTVVSHFLHQVDKEEHTNWKQVWMLIGEKKTKYYNKQKLIVSSISLMTGLPKETVRRKLIILKKKKILVKDKKKGIQLGEKFEKFSKEFTQYTTLRIKEMLNKWEKIGALDYVASLKDARITSEIKSLAKFDS